MFIYLFFSSCNISSLASDFKSDLFSIRFWIIFNVNSIYMWIKMRWKEKQIWLFALFSLHYNTDFVSKRIVIAHKHINSKRNDYISFICYFHRILFTAAFYNYYSMIESRKRENAKLTFVYCIYFFLYESIFVSLTTSSFFFFFFQRFRLLSLSRILYLLAALAYWYVYLNRGTCVNVFVSLLVYTVKGFLSRRT